MSLSKCHHFKSWFLKHWHFFFFNVVVKRFAWGYKKQNKSFLLMRLLSSRPPLSLCFLFVFLLPRPSSHMIKRENSASMYRLASDSEKMSLQLTIVGGIPSVEHVVVVCHRRRSPGYAYTAHLHLCSAERTCKQN